MATRLRRKAGLRFRTFPLGRRLEQRCRRLVESVENRRGNASGLPICRRDSNRHRISPFRPRRVRQVVGEASGARAERGLRHGLGTCTHGATRPFCPETFVHSWPRFSALATRDRLYSCCDLGPGETSIRFLRLTAIDFLPRRSCWIRECVSRSVELVALGLRGGCSLL